MPISRRTTSTNTTNLNTTHNNYDQRSVNDAGGGAVGDGNTVTVTDGGAFDIVGRLADGMNANSLAQTQAATAIASSAGGLGTGAMAFASQAQEDASSFNLDALERTFDLASASAANARGSSSDALGFARETFGKALGAVTASGDAVAGAYANATDSATGNRTLILVGIGVIGLAATFFFLKR
jgi:hypothetical protein